MKHKLNCTIICIVLFLTMRKHCYAQTFETIYRDEANREQNFYLARIPAGEIKAWMVILPSYGELPNGVLSQSTIPAKNFENGIATFILSLKGAETFYIDDTSQNLLAEIILEISKKYKLTNTKFVLGGFSLGGTAAVKYAEKSLQGPSKMLKPTMVFAGDPPLDLERFNLSLLKVLKRNTPAIGVKEAVFFRAKLKEYFGPNETNWFKHSCYAYSDTSNDRIQSLTNIAIRLYSEPDIEWMLLNRHYDYYASNSIDCAALINELQLMGNVNSNFITTTGKGIRANGQRHPHSWSIIDGQELVNWVLNYNKN